MLTAVMIPRMDPCFHSTARMCSLQGLMIRATMTAAIPKRVVKEASAAAIDPADGAKMACSTPRAFITGMLNPQKAEARNNMAEGKGLEASLLLGFIISGEEKRR